MNLNYLKDKNILILGFAREGLDTFLFLRKFFPAKILAVADQTDARHLTLDAKRLLQKDKNVETHFGPDYLKRIGDYDIVIKAPGIPPKVVRPYLKRNQTITSQTQIFFENCPGKIVGVTGTKGKSTTASLIAATLKAGGKDAHLAGNIGDPAIAHLDEARPGTVFVLEMSSYQLMDLTVSPRIAVVTSFFPEHLDYHGSLEAYKDAKAHITRFQGKDDVVFFAKGSAGARAIMKGGTVTRADLCESVHEQVGLTRQDCSELVERVLELMCQALERGEQVKLSGFGVFQVRAKRARMGRNPKTGEPAAIDPLNRYVAGLPAGLLAAALGLTFQDSVHLTRIINPMNI